MSSVGGMTEDRVSRRSKRAKTGSGGYTSDNPAETASPPAPSSRPVPMKPATDYIRHAAKLARKIQMDAAMGGTPQADAEFYKALSKALDEIAAGLELISRAE